MSTLAIICLREYSKVNNQTNIEKTRAKRGNKKCVMETFLSLQALLVTAITSRLPVNKTVSFK